MVCPFWFIGITTKRYQEIALGTIHILRQHNFGLFLTHPLKLLKQHKYSTERQHTGNFLDPPIQFFADVIYGWSFRHPFLSQFHFKKKERRKKNDLLRWNNAFNQSEIIQNFVPADQGKRKQQRIYRIVLKSHGSSSIHQSQRTFTFFKTSQLGLKKQEFGPKRADSSSKFGHDL